MALPAQADHVRRAIASALGERQNVVDVERPVLPASYAAPTIAPEHRPPQHVPDRGGRAAGPHFAEHEQEHYRAPFRFAGRTGRSAGDLPRFDSLRAFFAADLGAAWPPPDFDAIGLTSQHTEHRHPPAPLWTLRA